MDELDIDLPNAKLAYSIIQSLLDGHESLSDLLVVMSHALDEDTLRALTATNAPARDLHRPARPFGQRKDDAAEPAGLH